MMREHEEFEVETDEAGQWPVPFCSETVGRVVDQRMTEVETQPRAGHNNA